MIALLPLPGLVAKKIQNVQKERMKVVSQIIHNLTVDNPNTSQFVCLRRPMPGYRLFQKL